MGVVEREWADWAADQTQTKPIPTHNTTQQQEPVLFQGTIFENIANGVDRPVTEAEVIEAAKVAHIHDFVVSLPEKYQTRYVRVWVGGVTSVCLGP